METTIWAISVVLAFAFGIGIGKFWGSSSLRQQLANKKTVVRFGPNLLASERMWEQIFVSAGVDVEEVITTMHAQLSTLLTNIQLDPQDRALYRKLVPALSSLQPLVRNTWSKPKPPDEGGQHVLVRR